MWPTHLQPFGEGLPHLRIAHQHPLFIPLARAHAQRAGRGIVVGQVKGDELAAARATQGQHGEQGGIAGAGGAGIGATDEKEPGELIGAQHAPGWEPAARNRFHPADAGLLFERHEAEMGGFAEHPAHRRQR